MHTEKPPLLSLACVIYRGQTRTRRYSSTGTPILQLHASPRFALVERSMRLDVADQRIQIPFLGAAGPQGRSGPARASGPCGRQARRAPKQRSPSVTTAVDHPPLKRG